MFIITTASVLCHRFATVEFTVQTAREVSQVTGKDVPIVDSAPHMPGLQVLLRPGEGKLFVVRAKQNDSASVSG